MLITNALLYMPDHTFQKGSLVIKGKRIQEVCPISHTGTDEDNCLDANGAYVIPGLIDLHLHGCMA